MVEKEHVKSWYNQYIVRQKKIGTNLRHYSIMNYLAGAGLKKNHHVLEIGCGIGTLTGLLANYLKRGTLLATDISDESIEVAKDYLTNFSRVEFQVTDMKDFHAEKKFDFIVLPDVLEHIPVEDHPHLFKTIAAHMHENSVVVIHIPHPLCLDFIRTHTPEKLQIIDQSLPADRILNNAYAAGLKLDYFKSYSVFCKQNDYVLIQLSKPVPYPVLEEYPKWKIIYKKLIARMRYILS